MQNLFFISQSNNNKEKVAAFFGLLLDRKGRVDEAFSGRSHFGFGWTAKIVLGTAMAVVWLAIARDGGGRLTVRPSFLARGTSTTDNGDDEHIFRQDCALEPSEWPEWLRPRATSAGIALPAIHGCSRSQARSPEVVGGIIKKTKHTILNARWR